MSLLEPMDDAQGYVKAGFLGFPKSGKTWTGVSLACGIHKHFKCKKPIAFFDTEGGSVYMNNRVKATIGSGLVGMRSRSFDKLLEMAHNVEAEGHEILVVDSITHVWRELCDSFLQQINEQRKKNGRWALKKLEFQHWDGIKSLWSKWTDWYLNSPVHVIILGRAGYIYEHEKNEETGKSELIKTGTKMKVETDFGFEPSLLVEMEGIRQPDRDGVEVSFQRATVIGDRFGVIMGQQHDFPSQADTSPTFRPDVFEFFKPHIQLLTPGSHAPIDTATRTQTGADEGGDVEWTREKRQREILCEEIQGELVKAHPGQSAEDKRRKIELLDEALQTKSWAKVETMNVAALTAGLEKLRVLLHGDAPKESPGGDAGASAAVSPAPATTLPAPDVSQLPPCTHSDVVDGVCSICGQVGLKPPPKKKKAKAEPSLIDNAPIQGAHT
jgi:hypothetical protein